MSASHPAWGIALARAIAVSVGFGVTAPLMPRGLEPRIARLALLIALVPLLWRASSQSQEQSSLFTVVFEGALGSAALGLAASIVGYAVTAAGGIIDNALGAPAFSLAPTTSGPVTLAYQLAFACVLLQSGGLTAMITGVARFELLTPALRTIHGDAALLATFMHESVTIAGAPLFAQALATLFAGVLARASPQIGGLLFASSISPAAVALALVFGASTLWHELLALSQMQASLVHALAR